MTHDSLGTSFRPACAAHLISLLALGACANVPPPPAPVLVPVEIKDSTTIASARLAWHSATDSEGASVLTPGIEIEYDRALGRADQHVGTGEFISIDNRILTGPQDVRYAADLRYGHFAFSGILRAPSLKSVELETIAGLGQAHLGLQYSDQVTAPLAIAYTLSGVVLGLGPRWNISETISAEARFQALASSPSSDDRFWYRELAIRYRPVKYVAFRAGYAEMDLKPPKLSAGDSAVHVRLYGPFLGINLLF